jgi:flagellar biogenesis protein FliO
VGDLIKYAKAWALVQMITKMGLLIALFLFLFVVLSGSGDLKIAWSFK